MARCSVPFTVLAFESEENSEKLLSNCKCALVFDNMCRCCLYTLVSLSFCFLQRSDRADEWLIQEMLRAVSLPLHVYDL